MALSMAAALVSAQVSVAEDLPATPGTASVPGTTIIDERWLTQRTMELTVASPSFAAPVKIEVMLPSGYAATTEGQEWPVTY
ncbi:hypothetical protein [Paenarthrobacter sp. TA1.8]|uniref:hypothetical protein n=1 Tax=Paenarthrobacter sp. TA1.8 TaxID=3400219 RepID=UPI003B42C893